MVGQTVYCIRYLKLRLWIPSSLYILQSGLGCRKVLNFLMILMVALVNLRFEFNARMTINKKYRCCCCDNNIRLYRVHSFTSFIRTHAFTSFISEDQTVMALAIILLVKNDNNLVTSNRSLDDRRFNADLISPIMVGLWISYIHQKHDFLIK